MQKKNNSDKKCATCSSTLEIKEIRPAGWSAEEEKWWFCPNCHQKKERIK